MPIFDCMIDMLLGCWSQVIGRFRCSTKTSTKSDAHGQSWPGMKFFCNSTPNMIRFDNSERLQKISFLFQAVDDFIGKLLPLLSKGDIIIDGGNSEHQDSTRR